MKPVVCHVITGLETGGAERALARLIAHGLADTYACHVVSLAGDGPQRAAMEGAGAQVHLLGSSRLTLLLRLTRVLRDLDPALIQGWMYHGNLAASLASPFLDGRSTVWNIRQGLEDLSSDKFLTRQVIRLGRSLSRHPRAIIYNSHTSAAQHTAFGYSARSAEVIPNGFETRLVAPDEEASLATRARLGIPAAATLFLHLARYHPMKDHRSFLAAAVLCLEKVPNARFVLAGRGVGAGVTGFAEVVPKRYHAQFAFLDEVANSVDLMQAADVLVLSSSRSEGFPNVIGEAMMTATACIATDVGDCARIVASAGVVVPPQDPRALAEAMIRLAVEPGLRRQIGDLGRVRVSELYSIDAAVQRYVALYDRLLNEAVS